MSRRLLNPIRVLTLLVMALSLMSLPAIGQQKAAATAKKANAAGNWTVSRTPWGDPDLQGIYSYATRTPLERPATAGHQASYTEAELAALEEGAEARVENAQTNSATIDKPGIDYNRAIWFGNDEGRLTGRTSLIVEPEDGRIPPLTERGQKLHDALVKEASARREERETIYNSWMDHPTFTRCVSRPIPRGAFGQLYNYGMNIIQNPGYVVLHYESMHDVRVIPLDDRPHVDSRIRLWNGDSRGHWDGNTLVVDFTNFTDKQEYVGLPQGNMHVTERFTKVDANTINYQVTIDDPTTWTKPWTFEIPWRADDPNYQHPEDLYEYACHEGNFRMMEDSLKGSNVLKQSHLGK